MQARAGRVGDYLQIADVEQIAAPRAVKRKLPAFDADAIGRRARAVPDGRRLPPELPERMAATMRGAKGVGLAGPQVGLSLRVTTVLLDWTAPHPRLVFARNPQIVERSDDTIEFYEGCLSIPDVGGLVRRSRWVRVAFEQADGTPMVDEAEGPNAVLWQHEIDHLDGVLYPDRLLGELMPIDEMRRRREEREKAGQPVSDAGRARPWDVALL